MSTLSERIQTILDETGVESVVLARAAGVTRGTVSQWLTGQIRTIKLEYAAGIQDALGYSAIWLVLGRGDKLASAGESSLRTQHSPALRSLIASLRNRKEEEIERICRAIEILLPTLSTAVRRVEVEDNAPQQKLPSRHAPRKMKQSA